MHLARIAGLDEIDEIITDSQADPGEVDRLRASGDGHLRPGGPERRPGPHRRPAAPSDPA